MQKILIVREINILKGGKCLESSTITSLQNGARIRIILQFKRVFIDQTTEKPEMVDPKNKEVMEIRTFGSTYGQTLDVSIDGLRLVFPTKSRDHLVQL